jgi:ATP-dependent helicase HrpA
VTADLSPALQPADSMAKRLDVLTVRDAHRLRRRLSAARGAEELRRIAHAITSAESRVAARRASVPAVSYPAQLPITARVGDIRDAIRDHQVVVVAGETGSGKTTQLPKICLELGRGVRGLIGHTQPRRLAARTVADRIADELGTELGEVVGYQVRYNATVSDRTLLKIMTDGILLAEIAHDRLLRRYDTLIIDEAHERSLNIDLLLGYLAQLLPRRPDLKVIITSATIDTDRFARHFAAAGAGGDSAAGAGGDSAAGAGGDSAGGAGGSPRTSRGGPAPIIEVSGRSYPVELRYRPLERDDGAGKSEQVDQPQAIVDAVRELGAEGPGDILVFCSGEREIRDAAEALQRTRGAARLADEVIPLYARLSVAEQHRVFAPHPGRRVVLATNVAETSLTVPGIRYVVDTGNARISRYSYRTKVQRLPIEPVSQASARQRAGRCGRLEDGICIRLYAEEDYDSRPPFTDPEITRTNLASVLLQMAALGLGDPGEVEDFPFVDPPDRRGIRDGLDLLYELGALHRPGGAGPAKLTPIGRQLTQLPIDPRLGRMVLEAGRLSCVDEVIVIAAALSMQDPRERPSDKQQAADASHARFWDPTSDFLGMVNLWRHLGEQQQARSSSGFRRMCAAEFLHYLRVREWQDLVAQLRTAGRGLELPVSRSGAEMTTADPATVHQALLAGLLSHIGLRDGDKRDYLGARGSRLAIFPGSALVKKPPRWVMAAELVETSRLWARVVARLEPEWVEPLASHLVTRTYSEPHWEQRRSQVMAYERVTLYGLPIVARRKVGYGAVDPELSRELFIRNALVDGDWRTHHAFFAANQQLRSEVAELEDRVRRRDLMVDDEVLFDFYDQRVGPEVVSGAHFDAWWKKARRRDPELLTLTADAVRAGWGIDEHAFPDEVERGAARFPVSYAFEPGTAEDGVTVRIPLVQLPQATGLSAGGGDELSWQVPGRREELIVALIRSLPKALRRSFTPPTTFAMQVLPQLDPDLPLLDGLERALRQRTGVTISRDAWQLDRLPPHLRPTFAVEGLDGAVIATGKDLTELRKRLAPQVRSAVAAAGSDLEQRGLTGWPGGSLPRTRSREVAGGVITAYPALVDQGESVAVQMLTTPAEQESAMWAGTRRLLLLTTPSPLPALSGRLGIRAKLVLSAYPYSSVSALLADCRAAAVDELMTAAGGPAWDEAAWSRLQAVVRDGVAGSAAAVVRAVEQIVADTADVAALLGRPAPASVSEARADVRAQLDALVGAGFVTAAGTARLRDLRRYVRAMKRRLEQVGADPARDRVRLQEVRELQEAAHRASPTVAAEVRWMIEELRVSVFAQSLGTRYPISAPRIWRVLDG